MKVKLNQGVSLVEVVVSLAMIAFSLLTIVALQINIQRSAGQVADKLQALYLAESVMESIKADIEGHVHGAYSPMDQHYQQGSTSISITTEITPHSNFQNLYSVDVSASWLTLSMEQKSLSLRTLIYQ